MTDCAAKVVELLIERGLKISAAESCTGGLFTKMITDVAGSSAVLDASVVTYANEAKIKFLGVSESNIIEYGVVSEAVAKEMAKGTTELMGADIGVGITGIAGPGGGSKEKPVGLVWTAVCYKGEIYPCKLQLAGSREDIRMNTCKAVFKNIIELIEKH
ncbi:MAG: CinA family protein [Eubacteriales bacterium]|nr:CinA family protein [Eubacteriales bacterium]